MFFDGMLIIRIFALRKFSMLWGSESMSTINGLAPIDSMSATRLSDVVDALTV